jgi:murein L,D-transpeptidase YafK
VIDRRNPKSCYHLSLHISYPNAADRKRAQDLGVDPGRDIMIH